MGCDSECVCVHAESLIPPHGGSNRGTRQHSMKETLLGYVNDIPISHSSHTTTLPTIYYPNHLPGLNLNWTGGGGDD
ncbi:uncharacterized protein LAJ45_00078 [Morchella importuna]|uniref:uncharacterized protein n=1 Tax=Morchella importuna TaxID=1174673 RepID=UPI001E8DD4FF|nr:uncharacterized protein LAJ45_00078 [Morchella importuna]KAH8155069.1 hypothetical protein LAJ45_00078 [Morchella importuna]